MRLLRRFLCVAIAALAITVVAKFFFWGEGQKPLHKNVRFIVPSA